VLVLALTGCSSAVPAPPVPQAPVPDPRGATAPVQPVRSISTPTAPSTSTTRSSAPTPTPTSSPTSTFDRAKHSIDDPGSIWVVVDKHRPLQPKSYVPPDLVIPAVPHTNVPQLRKVAAAALVRMFAAAKQDGVALVSLSAYRSSTSQRSIFDRNVASLGRATTLKLTAKPGFSEHQTGLADDLGDGTSCDLQVCFESHPAAKWLTANAWRYGFIQRYPLGYTKITGIQVEPWHFRYVGASLAKQMRRTGVKTLEQFFDLPAAPDYR
jgi:D-alanyl-D-alanine carboxypeptidase